MAVRRTAGRFASGLLPALLLLLAGAGACGGDSNRDDASDARRAAPSTAREGTVEAGTDVDGTRSTVAATTPGSGGSPGKGEQTGPTGPRTATGPGAAGAGGFRDPETGGPDNTVPLQARITPQCVERGAHVVFEIRTAPGIAVAARVKYPTESFENLPSETGDAGANGVFTWRFRIPADEAEAGAGSAKLLVAVTERAGGSGRAQGNFSFTIAAPGAC